MAMNPNDLFAPLTAKLKAKIIQKFNLQPGGYDDAYLTLAMSAFSEAISEEIVPFLKQYAEVVPVQATPNPGIDRLKVDVPASGGGSAVTVNVYGKGGII